MAIVDDVAAVAARLAERQPGLHAPRIRALPGQVPVKRSPVPSAPLVAVAGVGGDMLRPVEVDLREDHFLVIGPPRSGRSTALRTLAASLRRGTPGLECYLLAPRRSPLMEVDGWTSMGKGADACRTMAERLAALVEDRVPDAPPVLVVVDDANEIGELLPLETLMRRGRDAGVRLLAAAESHATHRAFGGWVRELRNGRRGLLLMPDPETDGDLLGVRLPRSALAPAAPGRGYAVGDGIAELLQVAS